MRPALILTLLAAMAPVACVATNDDPSLVRIVADDLDRFWVAWDRAEGQDAQERERAFSEEYFRPASPGLRDFFELRIGGVRELLETIDAHPRYYASLREHTAKARTFEEPTRAAFRKLESIYPDAVFPDVYIVIGRLTSGGTTSRHGLLIGAEMYGMYPDTPTEELGDWLREVLKPMDGLPHIIAHELIHFQQTPPDTDSLLSGAIREGSADVLQS